MEQASEHIFGTGFLESFVQRYPMPILETLLRDRSADRNIIWADNEYEALGEGHMGDDEITVEKITGLASGVIKPRTASSTSVKIDLLKGVLSACGVDPGELVFEMPLGSAVE